MADRHPDIVKPYGDKFIMGSQFLGLSEKGAVLSVECLTSLLQGSVDSSGYLRANFCRCTCCLIQFKSEVSVDCLCDGGRGEFDCLFKKIGDYRLYRCRPPSDCMWPTMCHDGLHHAICANSK